MCSYWSSHAADSSCSIHTWYSGRLAGTGNCTESSRPCSLLRETPLNCKVPTFIESIKHGAIWHVPLPSAEAAGFMVKILRIWQDANKEMASNVEMPLNNSPASDSRSMNSMAHWGDTDSRISRLQGWVNNTANGLKKAIWKGHRLKSSRARVGLATITLLTLFFRPVRGIFAWNRLTESPL